ncbi:MAG: sigma-70 family RNA polymerase sigma factor [bacterium]|nr:sigma-70 family RNA polymerase sigma factor [bacterium]
MNSIEPTMKDILLACQKGDTSAFRKLVELNRDYVFALAVRYLGNEEDAGDVLQETFIRVWKHIDNFDFRCKFTTWLYRIVINLCNDCARSQQRHIKHLLPDSAKKLQQHLSEGLGPKKKISKRTSLQLSPHWPANLLRSNRPFSY